MKSKIIISAAIAACLTLCAAVWSQRTTDRQIPEPSPTPTVAAPQPTLPEPEEPEIPMITEKETTIAPEAKPPQEATTKAQPAPEIENRAVPETGLALPAQTELEAVPELTSEQEISESQVGDMVYVPGFGWLESQGEGTVIYDEMMYENGNKVGSMG